MAADTEGGEEDVQAEAADTEGGEKSRAKPSGIGRVLNGGQPLVCGHCVRQEKGVDGQLRAVDVSPQGVRMLPLQEAKYDGSFDYFVP